MKSASPASTVSTSVTPVSSTGYVTESSSTGLSYLSDYHGGASPRSISNSTTSTYTSTIPARVLSPHDHKSMALQGGPPDLRIAINHNPHDTSSQWQGGHHHLQPQSYQPLANHGLTNHSTRGSWDMYIENGQTNAGGNSAPSQNSNIHYPNPRNVADPAATGTDSRMARHLPLQQQHPQSQQMPHT